MRSSPRVEGGRGFTLGSVKDSFTVMVTSEPKKWKEFVRGRGIEGAG